MECFRCQGRYYRIPLTCGHNYCPIFSKINTLKTQRLDKRDFVGTSPGVFVGRFNYPDINVGILAPPEKIEKEAELYESPKEWSKRNFAVDDVLSFRSVVINSRFTSHVRSKNKYLEMGQEVAMASKPVDIEFNLNKKPRYQFQTSNVETVMGASAELKKAILQENPKIDRKVEYIVSDSDLKSVESLNTLYKKGFDETFLTKLLSIGNLGLKKQRRLVPTRWSITAVDDTLGKKMIQEVKDFKEGEYKVSYGGYIGNYFMILFFPRVWSFELFEMYMPSTLLNPDNEVKFVTDYELYSGRKKYADNCAGGYYACRIGVLEEMKKMKRQGAVVALRFTTEEYTTPLGVWVVREATRKSLDNMKSFDSEEEMLKFVTEFVSKQFNYNINLVLRESKVLDYIRKQKSIKDYFKAA